MLGIGTEVSLRIAEIVVAGCLGDRVNDQEQPTVFTCKRIEITYRGVSNEVVETSHIRE